MLLETLETIVGLMAPFAVLAYCFSPRLATLYKGTRALVPLYVARTLGVFLYSFPIIAQAQNRYGSIDDWDNNLPGMMGAALLLSGAIILVILLVALFLGRGKKPVVLAPPKWFAHIPAVIILLAGVYTVLDALSITYPILPGNS